MEKNIFELSAAQLKEIAQDLQQKVENGLRKEKTEVQCIPTYVYPKVGVKGKAFVLDLGGTNYRSALIDISDDKSSILPNGTGLKKDLSIMKTPGFTEEQLYKEQAALINQIKGINEGEEFPIGYCFSYPAQCMPDGDAELLRWTKGVDIQEMIGKPIGKPLVEYLNKNSKTKFTKVKVINDTVASLFAGLTKKYDAYIGLIVGTGTNMATFIHAGKIGKLDSKHKDNGWTPINLESGNFIPPHLNYVDDVVDKLSNNQGAQRFEKAVSGMYLGEILKAAFPDDTFEDKFDAQKLTTIFNYPDLYKEKYVTATRAIYERSAKLVAASLAGLILVLVSHNDTVKRIHLTAEGSLFWSEDKHGKDYHVMVLDELHGLLKEFGHGEVRVDFNRMDNANLIGSAIAALS